MLKYDSGHLFDHLHHTVSTSVYLLYYSYRVEMVVTDDTAEGAFVCFDGVMTRLHSLRASEAVQLLVRYTLITYVVTM